MVAYCQEVDRDRSFLATTKELETVSDLLPIKEDFKDISNINAVISFADLQLFDCQKSSFHGRAT